MLLDLPNELLLEVIYGLDPGSFSQIMRVCKALRSAALGTLPLKHQLEKVPGITDRLCGSGAKKLHKIFKRRTVKNLMHGVEALADVSRFALPASESLKHGLFMNCSCKTDHLLMATVHTKDASVGIHSIKSQFPILKCILSPTALDLGPQEDIQYEVVKMAFYDSHDRSTRCQCVDRLAVLYRYRLIGDGRGPFVEAAAKRSKEILKLVTWIFTDSFDATIEEVRDINTGGSLVPRALAMADDGSAIISYDINSAYTHEYRDPYRIELVQRRSDRYYDPFPPTRAYDTSCNANGTRAPSEISIIKRRVWFFYPGIPTPQYEIDDYGTVISIQVSQPHFSFIPRPVTSASFGFPLAVHHKHGLKDPTGEEYCLNSVLQLHIQNDARSCGAYIIKGVHFPDGCQYYNPLQRYSSLDHFAVAELGGLDIDASRSSSLGLIMAVSPRKRRIAIATWNRVQIWVVHPDAFFERQTHSNGCLTTVSGGASSSGNTEATLDDLTIAPVDRAQLEDPYLSSDNSDSDASTPIATHHSTSSVSSTITTSSADTSASNFSNDDGLDLDEWPWVDRCGWDYYSCYPRRELGGLKAFSDKGQNLPEECQVVSLQPVELPSQGVVLALAFNGEDNLWAWTDRGPLRWNFGGDCDSKRETHKAHWEVREMNVRM
ncbi:f-box domain cyclin-like protein [Diplodia corticola]|uniref:F-box domain cyclin-like protein n=1 Tax=Diplodia corticola TaxID=236234 RepID=A0A1J9S4S7_9PEZI|nr:f-box domain cyclin-like protein [Diplodia corticola]OJD39963.1 f-box domain cyclin-like protein [Diplodia corticola]